MSCRILDLEILLSTVQSNINWNCLFPHIYRLSYKVAASLINELMTNAYTAYSWDDI